MKIDVIKHNLMWNTSVGKTYQNILTKIGVISMRFARWCFRKSLGRCSYCGADCGLSSSISKVGKRCLSLHKNCQEE
jgi:hypothetical protein